MSEDYRVLIYGGRQFGNVRGYVDTASPEYLKKYKEYLDGRKYLEILACNEWPRLPEDSFGNWLPAVTVISGGAEGADKLGEEWAIANWAGLIEFKAEWDKHGKRAGILRNIRMLEEGMPHCAVQFPGGKGTAHMRSLLDKAGIKVYEYPHS